MLKDFKHIGNLTKSPRIKSKTKFQPFKFTSVVIISIAVVWLLYSIFHLEMAKTYTYKGEYSKALYHFIKSSKTGLFPKHCSVGVGVINYINAGKNIGNIEIDQSLSLNWHKIVESLYRSGQYHKAEGIIRKISFVSEEPDFIYLSALVYLVNNKLSDAGEKLLLLINDPDYHIQAEEKLSVIEKIVQGKEYSKLVDRHNQPIGSFYYRIFNKTEWLPSLGNIFNILNLDSRDSANNIKLTIDSQLQKSIQETSNGLSSVVLINNCRNGHILAACGSGRLNKKDFIISKFEAEKILLIPYLYTNLKQKNMNNSEILNKNNFRSFEQIMEHSSSDFLKDFNDTLVKLGFNSSYDYGGNRVDISSVLLPKSKGEESSNEPTFSNVWITPLFLSKIAMLLANDGNVYNPEIVLTKTAIDGKAYHNFQSNKQATGLDPNLIVKIKQNLRLSVSNNTFLYFFRSDGIVTDPIVGLIGYMPIEKPLISFCVIITGSHKVDDIMTFYRKIEKIIQDKVLI